VPSFSNVFPIQKDYSTDLGIICCTRSFNEALKYVSVVFKKTDYKDNSTKELNNSKNNSTKELNNSKNNSTKELIKNVVLKRTD
jgi:hypothetical protein